MFRTGLVGTSRVASKWDLLAPGLETPYKAESVASSRGTGGGVPGVKGRSGGHNRKSVAAHVLAGTYRPHRHRTRGDAATVTAAPPGLVRPARLSGPAQPVWDELAPAAEALGTLTAVDVAAFCVLCELEATFRAVCATKAGGATADALAETVTLERRAAAALRPYYALFGLTPLDRTRLPVRSPAPPLDPFAEFDTPLPGRHDDDPH